MTTKNIGERMARLEEKVDNQSNSIMSLHQKFDDFAKTADEKYASKWTEDFIRKAIYFVVFAVVGAVVTLVVVTPKVSAYFT